MDIGGQVAIVTGGASGLGRATVEALVGKGANVAVFDLNDEAGQALVAQLGDKVTYAHVDVVDETETSAAVAQAVEHFGAVHICVNCAGVSSAAKTVSRGQPFPLDVFSRVVNINLIGTFNALRLAAAEMVKNEPQGAEGERGVIINTASSAAFDGQVGQAAYAASKAGIVGMSLPIARDLARDGIRCNVIAPGLFETPLIKGLPQEIRDGILAQIQHPKRFGEPEEYALLATQMIENPYLNGECVRLDAATRLPPR
jgi:NAD(P)-dependent dehydrogenase (short-subunit alcohol dehydrogenase family)